MTIRRLFNNLIFQEACRYLNLAATAFLLLQGLELLFDVPVGLLQFGPSLSMSMSFWNIASDWTLLALIVSLSYAILAICAAPLLWLLARFLGEEAHRVLLRIAVCALMALFLSAVFYNTLFDGFPKAVPRLLPFGNSIVISLLPSIVLGYCAWLWVDIGKVAARLRQAGLFYSGLILLLSPLPFMTGAMLVNPEHRINNHDAVPIRNSDAPNIIVVLSDALSARAMSLYGEPLPTTPNLTRLAKMGTKIAGLTAVDNWTVPTTATLFSGLEPASHRVYAETAYFDDRPGARKALFLPSLMQKAGYTTVDITQNGDSSPQHQHIEEQFDETYNLTGRCDIVGALRYRVANSNIAWTLPLFNVFYRTLRLYFALKCGPNTVTDAPPAAAYQRALNVLDAQKDSRRPLLLWVHSIAPHDPYLPPPPHKNMFEKGNTFLKSRDYAEMHDKKVLALRYRENVHYVDAEFSNFFAALQQRQALHNTVLIFLADHGETFGRWVTHTGPYLDDDLIDIPLILWGRGITPGMNINTRVSQTDIAPTILDLAGIPKPDQMPGRSLVPLLKGQAVTEVPVYAESLVLNRRWGMLGHGTYAVLDGPWKYVQYMDTHREELFTLVAGRQINVASLHPDIVTRLRHELDEHFQAQKFPYAPLSPKAGG